MKCKIVDKKIITTTPEDVYDLTVDIYHNFLLSNGTIVHNCDAFQSVDILQSLTARGYNASQISVDRTEKAEDNYICKPYQYFKNCIYEGRFITFPDEELTEEIIDLERNINTGRVDHPIGGRKDVCDATCGAVFNASQNAEQFAYDYGEELETLVKVNNSSSQYNQINKLNADFEEQLQNMFAPQYIKQQKEEDKKEKQENNRPSNSLPRVIAVDGMLLEI